MKKFLKYLLITLFSLIVLFCAIVGFVIHFVFTPEKLTPVVLQVANNHLDAQLDMKRVELTFFSTFPQFGLELTEGSLVSKAISDSAWTQTDSLITFKRCLMEVQPLDFLMNQKVTIKRLTLDQARVYAFRDTTGRANWDIVKADTTVKDTATGDAPEIQGISVDRVELKRSDITFDDRDTRIYARLDSANLDLTAQLQQKYVELDLNFDNKNLLFWQNDQLLVNHLSAGVNANLQYDHAQRLLTLHHAGVNLNGIALDVHGSIRHDSVQHYAETDLHYQLHAPSLETVLAMIPEHFLKKQEVTARGEVCVNGEIKGFYGEKQMPLLSLDVAIKDAQAHYKGMQYGIDDIDMDFKGQVDLMRQQPSFADLKIFRFEGAHTTVLANARVEDLLRDPNIRFHVASDVDLTALAQTFPLQEGVNIRGKVKANLDGQCRWSSFKKQDYGRIKLAGLLEMNNMELADSSRQFHLRSDASLNFTGQDGLAAGLHINSIQLSSRFLQSSIQQMGATIQSSHLQDTTRIAEVEGEFTANEIKANRGDSMFVFTKQAKIKASLHPGTTVATQPEVSLSLDTDSLFVKMNDYKMGMDKGGFGIRAERLNDSIWLPSGIVGFEHLSAMTPQFKLPFRLESTRLTIKNQQVMLKNAHMKIGKSDITATGAIFNLYDAIKHHQVLKAKLNVSSHLLDGNQLLNALNTQPDAVPAIEEDTVSSEAPLELFVIPANIDFELHTQLKKVIYGKMTFDNVQGAVDVRNQSIHLKDLSMRGLDADMKASVVYQAQQKAEGYTGFDFALQEVNIGKLVDFIPALDSIVPMLRSFKGIVDFDVTAEARLDSALNIQIPTLRSAVHIKGDSLVLMDGETFAEISKMMMFKNKQRNLIDSIYVNITVDKGNVTVYPFVVQMDRYRAAVGGTQDLDMNFKYHISVLKSPVPFKLGVNISGNLEKMKFRIGKAKYKDLVTPVAIRKVDSTRMNLGKDIIQDFEKAIRQIPK